MPWSHIHPAAHQLDTIAGISVSLLTEVALIAAGMLLLGLIALDVAHAVRAGRRRERHLRARAEAEARNRALMNELCPHGWQAEITLHHGTEGRQDGQRGSVRLEWSELDGDSGEPMSVRRVWAPTVAEALEAMVSDRRTDETLEQIERGAAAEGALWPDIP